MAFPVRPDVSGRWPHPNEALAKMRQRYPPFERTKPFADMTMDGKNIIITGAASIMGRTMALKLAELGAELTLVDRDMDTLIPFAAELVAASRRPDTQWRFAVCDMTRPYHVDRVLSVAAARAGDRGIEGLVNCVGCHGGREHDGKYMVKKKGTTDTYMNVKDRIENEFEQLDLLVPEGFSMKVAERMYHNKPRGGNLSGGGDSGNVATGSGGVATASSDSRNKASQTSKSSSSSSMGENSSNNSSPEKNPGSLAKIGGEKFKARKGAIVNIVGESEIQTMADHLAHPPPTPFHLYNDTALARELWRTVGMTRAMAKRLSSIGIAVNGVSSGKMSTDDPNRVNKFMKWGRVAPAEEIAEMVLGFLRESSGTEYGMIRLPDPVKLGDLVPVHI